MRDGRLCNPSFTSMPLSQLLRFIFTETILSQINAKLVLDTNCLNLNNTFAKKINWYP